jgi:ATP-binding protein involved in chromosome partitioning
VKNLVAVASGKGGVGKTTVAVNLAIALKNMGNAVGLLDADVYGPNVPVMLGTNEQPRAVDERTIIPVEAYGLKMISMGLLNPGDKPLVWRGPMLHSVIQQFLRSTQWGALDYLIVDLPPGTGDADSKRLCEWRGCGHHAFHRRACRRAQSHRNVSAGECRNSRGGREHELL